MKAITLRFDISKESLIAVLKGESIIQSWNIKKHGDINVVLKLDIEQ